MDIFVYKENGIIGIYCRDDEKYSDIDFSYEDGVIANTDDLKDITDIQRQVDVVDGTLILHPENKARVIEVQERRDEARTLLESLEESEIDPMVKTYLSALKDLVEELDVADLPIAD